MKYTGQKISSVLTELSGSGLVSILSEYPHVNLFGDETKEELEMISQCNIETGEIDEIEFMIALSGE